jgi:hypothetical protein
VFNGDEAAWHKLRSVICHVRSRQRSPYSEPPVTYGAEAMRDELDYERRPAKANASRIGQVDWSIGVGPPIQGAFHSEFQLLL